MERKITFWHILIVATVMSSALWTGAGTGQPTVARDDHDHEPLDPQVMKIMKGAPYQHSAWGLLEVDPANERVIHALAPDQFFVPGSITKLFSVSAALAKLGFGYRFTTPVYALGNRDGVTLNGNLVLVAQGDLTLGGRTQADGTIDYTPIDHTVANTGLAATLTPEDPLAGINQLAQQVRAAGVTQVKGDVLIDDRLFLPDPYLVGAPVPISINDNLIDVIFTPGAVGALASVQWLSLIHI